MTEFVPVLALLGVLGALVVVVYGLARLIAANRAPLVASPHSGGLPPAEHAFSRYHVRWYTVTMVFLAFDMEMLFMYPWTLVVSSVGTSAVVEMFLFLGILFAGVTYAWREGAFRWA